MELIKEIRKVFSKRQVYPVPTDANRCATGTMLVGDATENNAGITGVTDNGDQSVRFYAGSNYAGKNTAPFRILDNGEVTMTKATIASSPTGKRIEINSDNNNLTFYDDANAIAVKIDDTIDFYDGTTGPGANIGGVSVGSRGIHLNGKRLLQTAFSKVNTAGNFTPTKHQTIIAVRNEANAVSINLPGLSEVGLGKMYEIVRYTGHSSGDINVKNSSGVTIHTIGQGERGVTAYIDNFYDAINGDWIVMGVAGVSAVNLNFEKWGGGGYYMTFRNGLLVGYSTH